MKKKRLIVCHSDNAGLTKPNLEKNDAHVLSYLSLTDSFLTPKKEKKTL